MCLHMRNVGKPFSQISINSDVYNFCGDTENNQLFCVRAARFLLGNNCEKYVQTKSVQTA